MSGELVREDPPPATPRSEVTGMLLDLRDSPNQWHRLPGTWPQCTAAQIRSGLYKGTRRGEYEVRVQAVTGAKPARNTMWVRYVTETP